MYASVDGHTPLPLPLSSEGTTNVSPSHRRTLTATCASKLRMNLTKPLPLPSPAPTRQGVFSFPTYTVRTPAVCPGPCPPPTALSRFLTAIDVAWTGGGDGGGAPTGFVLRPTGGGEAEEASTCYTWVFCFLQTVVCPKYHYFSSKYVIHVPYTGRV